MKAVGNVGEILMSTATLVAPAAPPVAACLAIAGGVLWAGSTVWSNRKVIGQGINHGVTAVKKAAGAVGKFVGGLFG